MPFVQNAIDCGLPEVLSLETFLSQLQTNLFRSCFSPFISVLKIHCVSSETEQQQRS